MKQYAEHDKFGVCHALRGDDIYIRTFSGGYPYIKNGVLVRSSSVSPIYSYGKNYEKDGKKFALFVWTTNGNSEEIESKFEDLLPSISASDIDQVNDGVSFIYK